jgi:hypothetical protein
MASDVQDGGQNSKEHNFGIFQYYCVLFLAMRLYFCQQHESKEYYFVKLVKNGGSIQNGGSKSDFMA